MPQYLAYTYLHLFFFGCAARLLPASAFKRPKIVENQSDRKYHHLKTGFLSNHHQYSFYTSIQFSDAPTLLEDLAASERLQNHVSSIL